MMDIYEYVRGLREDIPTWLDQFRDGDPFIGQQFFESRVVYYPGSGTDGHPVKVFASTHSAHCFVYVDYGVPQRDLEAQLAHPLHGFRGYRTLSRLQLRINDLVPNGWIAHVHPSEIQQDRYRFGAAAAPFGFLEVLERNCDLDDNHGVRRLAILFLGADGIAAYDALFCQGNGYPAPFAAVLQDHGFGGNHATFGGGGLLEHIARRCHALPQWLLVAENTRAWEDFELVPGVDGDRGGMHEMLRFLHKRRVR